MEGQQGRMEMEDDDFAEMMVKVLIEFGQATTKRKGRNKLSRAWSIESGDLTGTKSHPIWKPTMRKWWRGT